MANVKKIKKKYNKLNTFINFIKKMMDELESDIQEMTDYQENLRIDYETKTQEAQEVEKDLRKTVKVLRGVFK